MYSVPNSDVAAWGTSSGYRVPTAIDTVCPICRKAVTLTLSAWNGSTVKGLPFNVRCPRCGDGVTLIRLGEANEPRIFIDASQPTRRPVGGIDDVPDEIFPARLKKAYQSALNVLAIGEAESTAAACRRVLEGLLAQLLTNAEHRDLPLARRIQALAQHEQEKLAAPLVALSELLREGGNLGAHFDDEVETSVEDAEQMMELLDYLIVYMFVLPQQIKSFKYEVLKHEAPSDAMRSNG